MATELLNLAAQCCDADSYVHIGYQCSFDNVCFDYIRPIGITYWFSLPYRLGLPLNLLVWIQVAFCFTIALTSFYLFRTYYREALPRHPRMAWALALSLWTLALLAMGTWLRPTFFHTLSDTPASLLVVQALLLIPLAHRRRSALCYLAAAVLLGLAPLVRTAYLNPLLASLAVLLLLWLGLLAVVRDKKGFWRQHGHVLLLFFSLPLLILQCVHVWKNTGDFSFNTSVYSSAAYSLHLDNMGAGYDTYLPQNGVYWSPLCHDVRVAGLVTDWKNKNYGGMSCLLENRFRFYFGSYTANTYLGPYDRNFLDNGFAEEVGAPGGWSGHNLDVALHQERSPLGDLAASRLSPHIIPENGAGYYMQGESEMPLNPGIYHAGLWVWSNTPRPLTLRITNIQPANNAPPSEEIIAVKDLELVSTPQRISMEIKNTRTGYVRIQAGWFGALDEKAPPDSFSIWGGKIAPEGLSDVYTRPVGKMGIISNPNPDYLLSERTFSDALLRVNIAVMLGSSLLLLVGAILLRSIGVVFCAAFLLLTFAQCMLVVPEQRFVQALLMTHWTFFLLLLAIPLRRVTQRLHQNTAQ